MSSSPREIEVPLYARWCKSDRPAAFKTRDERRSVIAKEAAALDADFQLFMEQKRTIMVRLEQTEFVGGDYQYIGKASIPIRARVNCRPVWDAKNPEIGSFELEILDTVATSDAKWKLIWPQSTTVAQVDVGDRILMHSMQLSEEILCEHDMFAVLNRPWSIWHGRPSKVSIDHSAYSATAIRIQFNLDDLVHAASQLQPRSCVASTSASTPSIVSSSASSPSTAASTASTASTISNAPSASSTANIASTASNATTASSTDNIASTASNATTASSTDNIASTASNASSASSATTTVTTIIASMHEDLDGMARGIASTQTSGVKYREAMRSTESLSLTAVGMPTASQPPRDPAVSVAATTSALCSDLDGLHSTASEFTPQQTGQCNRNRMPELEAARSRLLSPYAGEGNHHGLDEDEDVQMAIAASLADLDHKAVQQRLDDLPLKTADKPAAIGTATASTDSTASTAPAASATSTAASAGAKSPASIVGGAENGRNQRSTDPDGVPHDGPRHTGGFRDARDPSVKPSGAGGDNGRAGFSMLRVVQQVVNRTGYMNVVTVSPEFARSIDPAHAAADLYQYVSVGGRPFRCIAWPGLRKDELGLSRLQREECGQLLVNDPIRVDTFKPFPAHRVAVTEMEIEFAYYGSNIHPSAHLPPLRLSESSEHASTTSTDAQTAFLAPERSELQKDLSRTARVSVLEQEIVPPLALQLVGDVPVVGRQLWVEHRQHTFIVRVIAVKPAAAAGRAMITSRTKFLSRLNRGSSGQVSWVSAVAAQTSALRPAGDCLPSAYAARATAAPPEERHPSSTLPPPPPPPPRPTDASVSAAVLAAASTAGTPIDGALKAADALQTPVLGGLSVSPPLRPNAVNVSGPRAPMPWICPSCGTISTIRQPNKCDGCGHIRSNPSSTPAPPQPADGVIISAAASTASAPLESSATGLRLTETGGRPESSAPSQNEVKTSAPSSLRSSRLWICPSCHIVQTARNAPACTCCGHVRTINE
jgi:hypothetical protein